MCPCGSVIHCDTNNGDWLALVLELLVGVAVGPSVDPGYEGDSGLSYDADYGGSGELWHNLHPRRSVLQAVLAEPISVVWKL